MSCEELAWAASRLTQSGLLRVSNGVFTPNVRAAELWAAVIDDHTTLRGAGFTRRLLLAMQPSEPATGEVGPRGKLSDRDYLLAMQVHIERTLRITDGL